MSDPRDYDWRGADPDGGASKFTVGDVVRLVAREHGVALARGADGRLTIANVGDADVTLAWDGPPLPDAA